MTLGTAPDVRAKSLSDVVLCLGVLVVCLGVWCCSDGERIASVMCLGVGVFGVVLVVERDCVWCGLRVVVWWGMGFGLRPAHPPGVD